MEKILRLNEQDIVQALADHFNVDRAKVNLTVKIRTEGYGPTEHQFPEVSAVIKVGGVPMRKLNSGDKLYVCDRKRCGDRCHYPDCRHTTDISHALNAPTFPNGFEKVKHNGNVYFVERED